MDMDMDMDMPKLTLGDFYANFRPFADNKTAYKFVKKLFARYVKDPSPYFVENGKIILDEYATDGYVHGSGYRTPELWRFDGDSEYFIRWCDAD